MPELSPAAIIGAEVSPIESLDYETGDHVARPMSFSLIFLVGALAGGTGFLTNLAVENVAGIKFVVTSNMMLAQRYGWAFGVFTASNFVLTMFPAGIIVFFALVLAGFGIPEVKAYLNGVDAPGIFSLRTLVVKEKINALGKGCPKNGCRVINVTSAHNRFY